MAIRVLRSIFLLHIRFLALAQVIFGFTEGSNESGLVAAILFLGIVREGLRASANDDAFFGCPNHLSVLQWEASLGHKFHICSVAITLTRDVVSRFLLRCDKKMVIQ